jgi:type VI secretion system protein ImpC
MSAAEQAQAAAATETTSAEDLIGRALEVTRPRSEVEKERTKDAFKEFVSHLVQPGQVVSKDVETNIKYWIGEIDKKLSAQLNEIMHHPDFQRLEGTWRGLDYLVKQSETGELLKIRVMNVSKRELFKDLEKAVEFDQSSLFKKVYEEEYGQLGGKPFGMLVGDYDFDRTPEDVSLLKMIAGVAASAHAPFVAAAAPGMFNFESFTKLPNPRDLAKIFDSVEYASWKSFRQSPDSRYVALTMPRVLARLPYGEKFKKVDEFNFEEAVDGTNHDKYLWMNSSWAYATRVTDAFAKSGWLAATRGVLNGGKVEGLPVHTFVTEDGDVSMKCPTEVLIPDRREKELSDLGFLPLLHSKENDFAVFMGAQSCQKPEKFIGPRGAAASSNAELSAKFNLVLCVSRFAHYLKVMVRDHVGNFTSATAMKNMLEEWINNYVHPDPGNAGPDSLARKPLAEARIEVKDVKGKPGYYEAIAHLKPHFQLEGLTTSMRLVAEMPQPKG